MLHYDVMNNGAISANVVESVSTSTVNCGFNGVGLVLRYFRGPFVGKSPKKGLGVMAFQERHDCDRFNGSARDSMSFHVRFRYTKCATLYNNSRHSGK